MTASPSITPADVAITDASVPNRDALRRGADLRRIAADYARVLSGSLGRLVLQAVYFFVLVAALDIHAMGQFAAIAATGVILGSVAGLGFHQLAFRAAAGRHRVTGAYVALLYGSYLATLPLVIGGALGVRALVFGDDVAASTFLAIVLVDALLWRIVEVSCQINNGLGHYSRASTLLILAVAARAMAAGAFLLMPERSLDTWAALYLAVNGAVAVLALTAFRPRVRPRFRGRLLKGRIKDAGVFAGIALAWDLQRDIDKLIIIGLVDERAAGLYAISTRMIELAAVPVKAFLVLYSRKLIREQVRGDLLRRFAPVEAGILVVSTAAYGAFLVLIHLWPRLLGANVESALPLFSAMLLVPAFKNLLDFHAELYFAYGAFVRRAGMVALLVALKSAAIAAMAGGTALAAWGLWLDAIFAGLYAVSAIGAYRMLASR
jgi:O-antigen/teichoic acid export membrane protein